MFFSLATAALSLALMGAPAASPVEASPIVITAPVEDREEEFWTLWDSLPDAFAEYKVEYLTTRTDGAVLTLEPLTYSLPAGDGDQHIYRVTKLYYA